MWGPSFLEGAFFKTAGGVLSHREEFPDFLKQRKISGGKKSRRDYSPRFRNLCASLQRGGFLPWGEKTRGNFEGCCR